MSFTEDKLPLPKSFYTRDTALVARELLGKFLVRCVSRGRLVGRIVETEAYYGVGDPASHSYKGKTKRAAIMWGPGGIAYVYFTYGMHFLINVVTEKEGIPGAVLIRALEPLEGIQIMKKNRNKTKLTELTRGPGRLTRAFGIDGSFNGHNLTKGGLFIAGEGNEVFEIECTSRRGVKKGENRKLRFYIKGNRFVS